jgi:NADPH:quinone reductase-like Zn-dependent oxidoreductase
MAQTTMASVEVVRGIAEAGSSGLSSNSATKAARRRTLPKSFTMPTFFRGSGSLKGKEKAVDESPLAFTSWRKPPGYVGANGVLVQIWAVGVDAVDQVLVKGAAPSSSFSGLTSPSTSSLSGGKKNARKKDGESTKKADVGFIPGRSFVGRVLECGWEVGEEVMKKNDWVIGLLDVKKCGAMAEFVVEDRRRLHRVPYPRMPSNSANPDASSHAQALALEELALLPLAGVPAHRAVCTFASAAAEANSTPRALVLGGHDGAGAMAVQMLARRRWRVSVHVPVPTRIPVIPGVSRTYVDEESRRVEYLQETENVIRSWGAEDVLFVRQHDDDADGRNGAIELMMRLMEANEEFDGVLDTVGGKEIWDAGEALLSCHTGAGKAQFTTLVGDTPERIVPNTSDLFKAGVRSTKTHGTGSSAGSRRHSTDGVISEGRKNKAKAKVGYAWVIINQDVDWQGEDIADSLRAVIREAAVQEGVRPLVVGDKIVPFEKTPEVFVGGVLGSGGTAVVKVVG